MTGFKNKIITAENLYSRTILTKADLANSEDDFNFRFNTKFNMMTIFSKLILVSLMISSVYPYTLEATIETDDDHLDDILGEEVNEMDYSNIGDFLGSNNNGSSNDVSNNGNKVNFDFVNENSIDEQLSRSDYSYTLSSLDIFLIVLGSLAPFGLGVVCICYCCVLCCENIHKRRVEAGMEVEETLAEASGQEEVSVKTS